MSPRKPGRPPKGEIATTSQQRSAASVAALKARGGRRITLNLEPEAVADLAKILREIPELKSDVAAIALALRHYAKESK